LIREKKIKMIVPGVSGRKNPGYLNPLSTNNGTRFGFMEIIFPGYWNYLPIVIN
jgi:hypothetical protein